MADSHSSEILSDDHEPVSGRTVPWVRPAFLFELYRHPPRRRTSGGRRQLSRDEQRYIAYRLAEGDTNGVISEAIGVPEATVRSFKRRLRHDATRLHDFEFVIPVDVDGEPESLRFWCRYCGNLNPTMWGAARHAIGHLR